MSGGLLGYLCLCVQGVYTSTKCTIHVYTCTKCTQASEPAVQHLVAQHGPLILDSIVHSLVDTCPQPVLRQPITLLYFILQHAGMQQGAAARLMELVGQQGFGGMCGYERCMYTTRLCGCLHVQLCGCLHVVRSACLCARYLHVCVPPTVVAYPTPPLPSFHGSSRCTRARHCITHPHYHHLPLGVQEHVITLEQKQQFVRLMIQHPPMELRRFQALGTDFAHVFRLQVNADVVLSYEL